MHRQENLDIKLEELRAAVDSGLSGLAQDCSPGELYDSVRYVLSGGGKRLRPLLLLLSADVFGADLQEARPLALAVELLHNFSLVHDDIMDHANTRRGRETVHMLWDTNTAILCGDVLLALAIESVSQTGSDKTAQLVQVFGAVLRELCEGQALDTAIETRQDLKTSDYLRMIDAKTGALLSGSLEMGGIFGGADSHARMALSTAGKSIGRAFQILDDLLDLVADSQHWGKVQGGDLIEGKRTFYFWKPANVRQVKIWLFLRGYARVQALINGKFQRPANEWKNSVSSMLLVRVYVLTHKLHWRKLIYFRVTPRGLTR